MAKAATKKTDAKRATAPEPKKPEPKKSASLPAKKGVSKPKKAK